MSRGLLLYSLVSFLRELWSAASWRNFEAFRPTADQMGTESTRWIWRWPWSARWNRPSRLCGAPVTRI